MKFGENVKTAMAGELSSAATASYMTIYKTYLRGKRRSARMWKIIVGDLRQNHYGGRNLFVVAPKGISEILKTQD